MIEREMRECDVCNESLPVDSFAGNCHKCRICVDSARLEFLGKRLVGEPAAPPNQALTDKCAPKVRERSANWYRRRAAPALRLLQHAKASLRRRTRTLDCTITHDDINRLLEKQGNRCFWTGVPLVFHSETRRCLFAPSLDRLDPSRGYHADNVVVCCWAANAARGVASREQFIEWLAAVAANLGNVVKRAR